MMEEMKSGKLLRDAADREVIQGWEARRLQAPYQIKYPLH